MNPIVSNLLLRSLPVEEQEELKRYLEPVALPAKTMLFAPNEVPQHMYLLTSGLASVTVAMEGGDGVEVGMSSHEGLPGSYLMLGKQAGPSRCFMQSPGTGLRIGYKRLEEMFHKLPCLQQRVLEHAQHELLVLQQLSACNRVHNAEERLARWLLMVSDLVGTDQLLLTEEFLSQMLGTRRTTITLIAGILQTAGLIRHRRGTVTILDRERLENAACECYPVTQRLLRGLYQNSLPSDPKLK